MRSRRKRKQRRPKVLPAQAGRLMLVVLRELLLGRHLDALCAIATSGDCMLCNGLLCILGLPNPQE